MINIKIDINSILPIIINNIKRILVELKKLLKSISDNPYNDEFVVFVKVKIDSLKEFSKFIWSKTKKLERTKTLRKKEIKIKNDSLTT